MPSAVSGDFRASSGDFRECSVYAKTKVGSSRLMAQPTSAFGSSMDRSRSSVWKHFKADGKSVVCNLCKGTLTKQEETSNMRNHLKFKHPLALRSDDDASKSQGGGDLEEKSRTGVKRPRVQPTLMEFAPKRSCKRGNWQSITQSLIEMCALDLRPLSIVDEEGFKRFVNKLDPTYAIPSHTTVRNYTAYHYESLKKQLVQLLKGCQCVAFTTDTWTSGATEGYLTLTIHFIDKDWCLNSYVLATPEVEGHHTGENLAAEIRSILSNFELTNVKVAGITTDNAANNITMTKALQWRHIRCFAHTLQLSVKAGLKVRAILETAKAASKLVKHFRKSTLARNDLVSKQKQLNLKEHVLISDSATRWNSTFLMFERLLEQRLAIFAVLHNSDVIRPSECRSLELSNEQWDIMEDIVSVLKPFQSATTIISGDKYPTLSMVYPIYLGIVINHLKIIRETKDQRKADSDVVIKFKEAASTDMLSRLPTENGLENHPVVIACALDPLYKQIPFLSEEKRSLVANKVKDLMKATAPTDTEEGGVISTAVKTEIKPETSMQAAMQFLLGDLIDLTRSHGNDEDCSVEKEYVNFLTDTSPSNGDPLKWWKSHAGVYPKLATLAKEYLCIPGTSVPSERVFSDTGNLVTKKRTGLDSDTVDQSIFIRAPFY